MRLILIALLTITLLAGCTRSVEMFKKAGSKISKSVSICTTPKVEKASISVSVGGKNKTDEMELEAPSFKSGWDTKMVIW